MAIGSDAEIGVVFTRWGEMDAQSRLAWFARMRDEWGSDLVGGYGKVCYPRKLEDWEVDMDYNKWLAYGQREGWISNVYCEVHESTPLTDAEYADFDNGVDPCVFVVRIYDLAFGREQE